MQDVLVARVLGDPDAHGDAVEAAAAGAGAGAPATPTTDVRSITLYGAPQIPAVVPFGPEHAFTYPPSRDVWSGSVPASTDILITHTPPESHLELSPVFSLGCPFLLSELWRVRPSLHVFGHVHHGYGSQPVFWDKAQRSWECLCSSRRDRATSPPSNVVFALLADLLDLPAWVDAAKVLIYGLLGLVWARVWGGDVRGAWLVNAACMYGSTGRLGNKPQVVVL